MEAAAPAPTPGEGSNTAGVAGAVPGSPQQQDSIVIHPYLYPHAVKGAPEPLNHKALAALVAKGHEKEAQELIKQLKDTRLSFSSALQSTSVSDAAVSETLSSYLSQLSGLLSAGGGSPAGAAPTTNGDDGDSLDAALAAAEGGAAPSTSPLAAPASRLRHAVPWEWAEAVLAPLPGARATQARSTDAAFEAASAVVAAALRLGHSAAAACEDSASGVPTVSATRAYAALRSAAGMLDLVARQLLPVLPGGLSADLDPRVVRALSTVMLADAQQLTFLRAIQKNNQPSLVSALAVDTAALFAQAANELGASAAAGAATCKLASYAAYKQSYCLAYAHLFNGISLWRADQGGAGLKAMEAAAGALAAAKRASPSYDVAPPASLNLHHRRVDEELAHALDEARAKLERENRVIYLQRVPAEVPALPAGKRLVSALPYTLPPTAAAVRDGVVDRCFLAGPPAAAPTAAPTQAAMRSGGAANTSAAASNGAAAAATAGAAGGGDKAEGGCSFCRFLAVILAFPVLAACWLLGAVIWVLLLPLKCCCPCCGFPLQWAADLALWLLRAPANGLLWATKQRADDSGGGGGSK